MNNSFGKILGGIFAKIFFLLLFITPVIYTSVIFSVLPMIEHDLSIPYGRTFLHPEHGRYIATGFANLLFEKIPIAFNIHPFDLNISLMLAVRIVLMTIVLVMIAAGFLLFYSKRKKNDLWILLFGYLAAYFLLCNRFFMYLVFYNLVPFLEYDVSVIPLFVFFSFTFYFYVKDEIPSKFMLTLFLISAFFTGITTELINTSTFLYMSVLSCAVGVRYFLSDKNEIEKARLKFFLWGYFVLILACGIFFLNPTDHDYQNNHVFFTYWKKFIPIFWENCILRVKRLYFVLFGLFGILFFTRKIFQKQNLRLATCIAVSNLGFLLYFLVITYLIACFSSVTMENYDLFQYKFVSPYAGVILFQIFVVAGYFFETADFNSYKKEFFFKILMIAAIFLSVYRYQDNNLEFISYQRNHFLTRRIYSYQLEKLMMQQAGKETIVLPLGVNEYYSDTLEANNIIKFLMYIHYPDFQNLKMIVSDDNVPFDNLSDEELKDLKFSNLLKHKIIKGDMNFGVEKVKEEGSKVYYQIFR